MQARALPEVIEYLDHNDGSSSRYLRNLGHGLRHGQAFYDALNEFDQDWIWRSSDDPFHSDIPQDILKAVCFLETLQYLDPFNYHHI